MPDAAVQRLSAGRIAVRFSAVARHPRTERADQLAISSLTAAWGPVLLERAVATANQVASIKRVLLRPSQGQD